jgi:hypothetical protein
MSLNFPVDTSVQLSYSSFPFATPSLDNYTTSNYVSNISNVLINNINAKQPILTAATTLLGIGSSISALDYNKITINKPSFFPTDWNSTISNKPTYFQTDWNTTITNKPSTFPVDTTVYYNKTETNNLLNAKQATLTFSSPLVNTTNTITFNESSITTLTNFYNKTEANNLLNAKQATLTFSSPLVNTTNTITFNESAITTLTNFYNKTEANARYLQLAGGDLTGTLNIKTGTSVIHFGTRLIDNLLTLWGDGTSTYGIGVNNATLRYNAPTNTTHRFYTGTTNTVTIDGSGNVGIGITNPFASLSIGTPATTSDGTLTISRNNLGFRNFKFGYDANFNFCMGDFSNAVSGNTWRSTDLTIRWETGNVGIGITPQTQKLYVNGSSYINGDSTINGTLTATAFSGDGANITNVPYSTITGKPTNFQADWNTTIINKPSTFPVDTTVYYNKTEVNNLLNAKQATLTFSSPLVNTANTISFSESAITTLTNFYNKTEANARYLQLSGGTMTGAITGATSITTNILNCCDTNIPSTLAIRNLNLIGDAAVMRIWRNHTTNNPSLEFISGATTSAASYTWYWDMFIGASSGANYFGIRDRMNANAIRLFIDNSGNVGIGITTAITYKLNVNGSLNSTSFYQNGILIDFTSYATNTNLTTNYYNKTGSDARYLQLTGGNMTGGLTTTGNIICNGQLGIGTTSFTYKLYVNGVSYLDGNLKCAGIANIHNNSPYAVVNNFMASGSLTIGGTNANYGTATSWSSSTAGLLMECADYTEIAVHDGNTRLSSLIYYDGPGNNIYIGRDKGWGSISKIIIPNVNMLGGNNVSKRSIFLFDTQNIFLSGIGIRNIKSINLDTYMTNTLIGPLGNQQYIFRIHIWSSSGDFGDSINNVESMSYIVYLANWGGGAKIRINQLANSSNGSYIAVSSYNTIYYSGWNGTGGASQKYCVIENISSY